MSTFKSDFIQIINNENEKYLNKINSLLTNETFLLDLSINEAEKLIEYLKQYKHLINSLCSLIDNMDNTKKTELLNDKIEAELYLKIIPIMNIYRLLLNEKYKKDNVTNVTNVSTFTNFPNFNTTIYDQD